METFLFVCVAGFFCQFPGVDRKKPTRVMTDILTFQEFGDVVGPSLAPEGTTWVPCLVFVATITGKP